MWKIYFCPTRGATFTALQGQYNTRGEAEQCADFLKRKIQGVIQVMQDCIMTDEISKSQDKTVTSLGEYADVITDALAQQNYKARSINMSHTIWNVISSSKSPAHCSYSLRWIDGQWECSSFSSDSKPEEINEILAIARGIVCDEQ